MKKMKPENDTMIELEQQFMKEMNQCIMNLLSIKFRNKISKITQYEIKDIIQYHLNETIWLDQIKDNLNTFIFNYTKDLESQKGDLNKRMDCIEQQLLNVMHLLQTHKLLISVKDRQ